MKLTSDADDDGCGTTGLEVSVRMFTHRKRILNRDPKDEILKAFRPSGEDVTGKISFQNLMLISDVDNDRSGTVGLVEFFKFMTHKILNRDPKDEFLKALRLLENT